jgi:hypothetical protein
VRLLDHARADVLVIGAQRSTHRHAVARLGLVGARIVAGAVEGDGGLFGIEHERDARVIAARQRRALRPPHACLISGGRGVYAVPIPVNYRV